MPVKLPIYKKLKYQLDSLDIFERLSQLPFPFLLDTGMIVNGLGRHSFIGVDPFLVMSSKGQNITITRGDQVANFTGSPLQKLKHLFKTYTVPRENGLFPFNGGAVGYFGYDLGRLFERLPEQAADDLAMPDLFLGFYDTVVAVDVITGFITVISTGLPEQGSEAEFRAARRLEEIEQALTEPKSKADFIGTKTEKNRENQLVSNFSPGEYRNMVRRAVEYIAAGDIFQVNLSQRFCTGQTVDAWELYRRLRKINPAPMAAFLSCGEFEIISASPERYLKVDGNRVETRPIKGTRPRGHTPGEDSRLRRELLQSEKDRAELMMIVDLERNDLGRVCEIGTVKVPELYRLEEYATVFHLVSTVEGRLAPGYDVTDLLAASFPGGSITGAPKIRAMEIIEEMEPVRRGVYTGSIGYLGFDGRADLNIVIRTILAARGKLFFQVGGGITADSDPHKEYVETLDKARALVRALGLEDSCNGF
ncbi:para-aminobenzoate synthetase component 1 [Desulfotomaculum arcticum]|uniref:aminodeoxychorismate synthase n=1 Tax=Desulfotruncus arcticus DSM 17038 TaxID=1121424 RepID=A0A1I2XXT5_9FIRM|nr:aminodeoxychorismate synthase, component I [Desulfotruncus arcticus]SFH17546.1 para-aminobenzoate synthetase component 1 [Desulfotomaculum arcticum] [Desulfotruncus arcticus DSM 17038]